MILPSLLLRVAWSALAQLNSGLGWARTPHRSVTPSPTSAATCTSSLNTYYIIVKNNFDHDILRCFILLLSPTLRSLRSG